MIEIILQISLLSSLVVMGVWAATAEGMILEWIKDVPVLNWKVISGSCPCPASFYTPIVFVWTVLSKIDILVRSHDSAISLWHITSAREDILFSSIIAIMALCFSILGTAGILFVVRTVIDYLDFDKIIQAIQEDG